MVGSGPGLRGARGFGVLEGWPNNIYKWDANVNKGYRSEPYDMTDRQLKY